VEVYIPNGDWRTGLLNASGEPGGDYYHMIHTTTDRLGIFNGSFQDNDSAYEMLSADFQGWHHIAAVGSGSNTLFYVDGVYRCQVVGFKSTTSLDSFGSDRGGGQRWAHYIDEIAVWDRPLLTAEIASIFNAQDGPGNVLFDSSGEENNAIAVFDGYTEPSEVPFSGAAAWSGSGTNSFSIPSLPITGSAGLSFSTWLNPVNNLTEDYFHVFDFTNGTPSQDISLYKTGNGPYGAYHNVYFAVGTGFVSSRGMFDQDSGSVGGEPLQSGWVHWVATADGAGLMSLYKNGQLINSASGQGAIPDAIRDNNYIGIDQTQYGIDVYSNSASFLPDVDGDYVVRIIGTGSSATGFATASIGGSPPSPPSGSTLACIQPETGNTQSYFGSGFVINNYLNLSGGRLKRTDQVPFSLGTKDRLGLRLDNTIATTSGSTPTYCTGS